MILNKKVLFRTALGPQTRDHSVHSEITANFTENQTRSNLFTMRNQAVKNLETSKSREILKNSSVTPFLTTKLVFIETQYTILALLGM